MNNIKIEHMACARIPTEYGEYQLCLYRNNRDDKDHLALVFGDVKGENGVLVRVHSECFTGDVLGSRRCDCGEQLQQAMQMIAEAGAGVIVYLRQEGRGIGLLDKLRAYNLQDQGYDTVEANLALGHEADERDYSIAALILQDLGVRSVRLLTNNPEKIACLETLGISVTERIALEGVVNDDNAYYLFTKAQRMNHLLNLVALPVRSKNRDGNGKNGSHQSMAV
jgi:3,4-dihydroxy 2-butanone 4-phosphate synthase/GTP cyclohydrolase II